MAAAEVQALLRFLTQDAKIPLTEAMPKVGAMRKHGLMTAAAIAGTDIKVLQEVFVDEKHARQVVNAAKRVSNPKKRSLSQADPKTSKRSRTSENPSLTDIEAELVLPGSDASIEELEKVVVETNRAPLVLAFALVSLEFTMPNQPVSSRLSLAQAVVSANSQTKAKSIGLTSGATAEEEGWMKGQPRVKVLTREIAVMRRQIQPKTPGNDHQEAVKVEELPSYDTFWGLDIEALRRSNGPLVAGKLAGSQGPPIHTAQAARSYLLRSISPAEIEELHPAPDTKSKQKPVAAAANAARKEQAVGLLLKAIRLVCESWSSTLSTTDLDRKAWFWYLEVRPDVAQGQSGWGQRGRVRLADILKLKRRAYHQSATDC